MKIKNTFCPTNISMSLRNLLQCVWTVILQDVLIAIIKSKLDEIKM